MEERKCVYCGAAEVFGDFALALTTDGVSTATTVRNWHCPACGKGGEVSAAQSLAAEAAHARAVVAACVPGPKAFGFVRKHLGYSPREAFAALLGVTTEDIKQWEAGADPPPRYARALLVLLALDAEHGRTTTRDVLEALRDERPVTVGEAAAR